MAFSIHDLPWTPTLNDMQAPQTLRANKIKGEFANLQECADIHYQLMKENFMRPIRVGIEHFRTHKKILSSGLRFYFNVRIDDIIFCDKIHHRLQFDSSEITLDEWKYSGRLAFGSLLLISCNNFESFVYATVINREVGFLTQGYVDVEIIPEKDSLSHLLEHSSGTFVMAESVAHYESYSHVLSALKQAKICNRLQEYIIKYNPRLERPGYLTLKATYDMSNIMNDKKPCKFEPLKPGAWPDNKETCLNETQYKAVQLALTKEMAVIQGPPGAGKTFVCLKIIETLLKNSNNFQSPILVLCKTSEALDEILERVLKFCESKVVRFGDRSKSDTLNLLNFDNIKRKKTEGKEFSKSIQSTFWDHAQMLAKISEDIAECHHRLGSLETEIQSPEVLMEHMIHTHRQSVKRGKWSVQSVFDWLSGKEYGSFTFGVKKVLQELFNNTILPMSEKEEMRVKNLNQLKLQQRLELYKLWINKYRKQMSRKMAALLQEYHSFLEKTHHTSKQQNSEVLESASVIGMTFSEAAKHSWELRTVRCKIVLAEDAAEVFESQILAALDQWCEHLILVGDHHLGGPSSAVFQLMNEYGLGISLFERLINNGIPYVLLNEQYTVCSSISNLMCSIYPKPISNKHVPKQNDLISISKNVFFIHHNHKGKRCSQSGKEVHACESDYLVAFCKYLLIQGHKPSMITILTINVEQMLAIKTKLTRFQITQRVLVTTVDRYRNREHDIILLSFIRSEEEIGDCVPVAINQVSHAFSRAKNGFFAIGDFESLKSKSKQWSDIINCANISGTIGTSFPVNSDLTVSCAEMFTMYISYKKLLQTGPVSLKYDFLKSFTVKELKAASFQIKYAYCLLKIKKMKTNKTCFNFIAVKDVFDSITHSLTHEEKNKFRLALDCLLYLVVIAQLEKMFVNHQMLNDDQKLLIMKWKDILSGQEINAEILDSADDFVETLMLSGIDVQKLYVKILGIAHEVDQINTVLFSEDKQMLCDIIEKPSIPDKTSNSIKQPLRTAHKKRSGKVIHGRQLYWVLADKSLHKQ